MNSWLNQGRLRRPGRGLKSKRIRQQTIQKTASHTEFLTLPSGTMAEHIRRLVAQSWLAAGASMVQTGVMQQPSPAAVLAP